MWAEEYLKFCVVTCWAATSFRNWNRWMDSCVDPFYPRCAQYEKLSISFEKDFCIGEKLWTKIVVRKIYITCQGSPLISPVNILNNRWDKHLSWLIVSPQNKISELNHLLTFPVWIYDSVMSASCRFGPIRHSKSLSILIHLYSNLSSMFTILL